MRREQVSPNTVTFLCTLKACGIVGSAAKGEKLHAKILRYRLLGMNSLLGTALVDMYAKCGSLGKARDVFDHLPARDVISWTALIGGYVQHGLHKEALDCYESMQIDGVSPNAVTFVCVLRACGSMGTAEKGEEIHVEISRRGLLTRNILVSTALVDMYAKLGDIEKAHKVFNELEIRDLECWNAMLSGYGQLGQDEMVISLFNTLVENGMVPSPVTCNIVLNACSHSGLLDKGRSLFGNMNDMFGLIPTLEHCTCMVDLFARAGLFDEALTVIHRMPMLPDYLPIWTSILGACQKWANTDLGELAFRKSIQLDEKNGALYTGMGNIYTLAIA
jgi:pentatricopeptide repeat protein